MMRRAGGAVRRRRARIAIAAATVTAVLLALPTRAPAGQPQGLGLRVFTVNADRTGAFEDVINRLLNALQAPTRPSSAAVGVKFFRDASPGDGRSVRYVLLIDVSRAASVEDLIREVLPDQAAALTKELAFATDGRPALAADLRMLRSLDRTDALRDRIDGVLAQQLGAGAASAPAADGNRAAAIAQLQGSLWRVDRVAFRRVEATSTATDVDWSFTLTNLSPQNDLRAVVAIDFCDTTGAVIDTARTFRTVPVGGAAEVSGRTRLSPADAARIATTSVRIEPQ
jgi:hypothetical protein